MAFLNPKLTFLLMIAIALEVGMVQSYNIKAIKKTIQSPDGDTIDCIDIHKQPSLKHPLLKNHTIKVKPDRMARHAFGRRSNLPGLVQTWRLSGACPKGTIPIRRISASRGKEATIPSPHFNLASRLSSLPIQDATTPRTELAVDYSIKNPYLGASADIYVWNIHVEPDEYSANFIGIEGGYQDFSALDTAEVLPLHDYYVLFKSQIEAGWMVNPSYFGDALPRLYIYYSDDGSTVCFNYACQGFVQTSPRIALGASFANTSVIDGPQNYIVVSIYRESGDYKWWISINHEEVGYYPGEIFHDFYMGALVVRGGAVLNNMPGGKHTSTQMGNGHFPSEGLGRAGLIGNYLGINGVGQFFQDPPRTSEVTSPGCYDVKELGTPIPSTAPGYFTLYGGPGGPDCA